MSKDTTGCTSEDPFIGIGDLLVERKITSAAIATAIEKEGVYTWDRFGRFIPATDGDCNDSTSKAFILDLIAKYYRLTTEPQLTDEEEWFLFNMTEDWPTPLHYFGWRSKDLSGFKA
jgi:hypothetical protein